MLCQIGNNDNWSWWLNFVVLWTFFTVAGLLTMILFSGGLFIPYYVRPTFERWVMKNNKQFPPALLVKKEIIHMCKGLVVATLCPTFTIMATRQSYPASLKDTMFGNSKGYCEGFDQNLKSTTANTQSYLPGLEPMNLWKQALVIFFFTDLFEYAYHWCGHRFNLLWSVHKHHHMFYNPTPFAVIADEYLDQFVRTMPMVILPWFMPINMDLLFGIFMTLFYGYGVYLHWGYETSLLTAHNPIFNTAYHHYIHHAKSSMNIPIYTGFFFKLWDQICGTNYKGECECFQCREKKAPRTIAEWKEVEANLPDYSVLLSWSWWMSSDIASVALTMEKKSSLKADRSEETTSLESEATMLSMQNSTAKRAKSSGRTRGGTSPSKRGKLAAK